ncbi:MAG: hypothetical protein M1358_19795 [Chloroflexi bacterium]|nr:hypothetical protein [Chloroflexota bacterium]
MHKGNAEFSLPEEERRVFKNALKGLNSARVPYVIGGAFAVYHYSSIWRDTKDLDLFVTPENRPRALNVLSNLGYDTWIKHEPWLAKATVDPYYVDIIYGMGNWMAPVDEVWIDKATPGTFLKVPVLFAPAEEIIWAKAFIAGRERYDGGDVNHIIRGIKGDLDWMRLIDRFKDHWELLMSTLLMFRYVYPSNRDYVPNWVLRELIALLQRSLAELWTGGKLCRGPLLDGIGTYAVDVEQFGYRDARKEIWAKRQLYTLSRPAP